MDELRQRRLGLLFGLSFWVNAVLFLGVFLAYQSLPEYEPANVSTQHAIAIAMFAIVLIGWVVARSERALSPRTLDAIEWAFVIVTGPHFGAQAYLNADLITPPLLLFTYAALAAMARAVIVPSTARRTLLLSGVAMAGWGIPAIVAVARGLQRAPEFPPSMLIPFIVLLCTGITCLAGATSLALHRLRTELEETTRAGAYRLGRRLGAGAMGDVFEARHAAHKRSLAVKIIEDVGQDDVRRLQQVLAVTSELDHPGIARIYDYGSSAAGSFYYAMELIDGIDLETLVREYDAQPIGRALAILEQIRAALHGAHCQGVVHRDLKPANVLLMRRPGMRESIMLVDFGVLEPVNPDSQLTSLEVVEGTPGYMAPEAITDPDEVGPQADVYALGSVAYFLLTGHTVFDGKTVAEMCAQHIHNEPEAPSTRIDVELPNELDELILACLAKKPDERPRLGDEVREMIETIVADDWSGETEDQWWSVFDAAREADAYSSSFSRSMRTLPARPSE